MCDNQFQGTLCSGKDVGHLINTISHQLKRQMCMREGDYGLTNMQKIVLRYILFQSLKSDVYQKDLEKEFQIRRSTATGILQILERDGFIHRETAENDARLKKIIPTEKAIGKRTQIIENIRFMESLLREGIPEEDLQVCIRVLGAMSENLLGNEREKERGL